ncbi:hypothetical protein Ahy_A07g035649 [Arachis hypogaea]|uniref:EF-hand domain-containing protein n=1 Tax=Arachis hypogaea TaxID=3818 RepID=A0A445CEC5_ARAHY|nr:hypothetical protein Ahy_A07g035649 [Arachis hypogaea]
MDMGVLPWRVVVKKTSSSSPSARHHPQKTLLHRKSETPVTTDPHSPLTATYHSPLTTDCRSKLSRPLALIVARRPDRSSTFVVSALTITGHHRHICAHCRRSTKLSLLLPLHLTLVVSVPTVAARLASSFSLLTIVEKLKQRSLLEVAKKSLEKAAECVRCLEEDMAKARVDKDADGRITEEEIKEIICLSATTNKLSNIQQQAKEYAALIMEELDPEETGFIMNNVTSSAKTIAGSTPRKQNQRHESSARIIRSILSNKEMRQSQSTRPQSE